MNKKIIILFIIFLLIPKVCSQEWKSKESEHFIFYFEPGSKAERDIDAIIEIQEKNYQIITDYLNVEYEDKIKYYIYTKEKFKETFRYVYGMIGITLSDSINIIYEDKYDYIDIYRKGHGDSHELTHFLTMHNDLYISYYMEAVAEYIERVIINKYPVCSLHAVTKALLETGDIPNEVVSDPNYILYNYLMEEKYTLEDIEEGVTRLIERCFLQSWTTYLIEEHGKEKFLDFFKLASEQNPEGKPIPEAIREVYGKDPDEMAEEWKSYLRNEVKIGNADKLIEALGKATREYKNVDSGSHLQNQEYNALIDFHENCKYVYEILEMYDLVWTEEVCIKGFEYLKKGKELYDEKEYEEALKYYEKAREAFFDISCPQEFEHTENLIKECEKNLDNKKEDNTMFYFALVVILAFIVLGFIFIKNIKGGDKKC